MLILVLLCGCGNGAPPPPAPAVAVGPAPTDPGLMQPAAPASLTTVTLSASSEPAGAVVTANGQMLGTTPVVGPVTVPVAGAAPVQLTFQLPGYQPTTVEATPVNGTLTAHAALIPFGAAAPVAGIAPASTRTLAEVVRDFQPTDASDRFVWARSQDDGNNTAQLLCGERAVEAARRAAPRFRGSTGCSGIECSMGEEAGNSDPYLFAERTPQGLRLIGYWNGMAGDASRERIEAWRSHLACDEIARW